jgi:hypothetical protein
LLPPSTGSVIVHLAVPDAPQLQALSAGLTRNRVQLAESAQQANVVVLPHERVADSRAGALPIALIGAKLEPAHAALLRREQPALLLSGREDGTVPSAWELDALARLLAREDLVPAHVPLSRFYVGQVSGLRQAATQAINMASEAGAPRNVAESIGDVLYEIAANALLDAPVAQDGVPKYAHRRDDPELTILAEDTAVVGMGVHEGRIYLAAFDRFGRFGVEPVARTVEGLAGRAKVNDSGGGAGLGLRRIIEQSDLLAVRVVPQRSTEVLAVIQLSDVRRRATSPKSLFFCIERG